MDSDEFVMSNVDAYTFDPEAWMSMFPIEKAHAAMSRCGPGWICLVEQFRRRAAAQGDMGRTVPTDLFVLSYGEPPCRDVTKIGGLPYRPADRPWPVSKESGEPLSFAAQFRFTESKDLVPSLPGDILLCFFDDIAAAPYDWFPGPPVFEWYPLGLSNLVMKEAIPSVSVGFEDIPICYGSRYRTVDYPDRAACELVFRSLPDRLLESHMEDCPEPVAYLLARQMCRTDLFKIGGAPYWEKIAEVEKDGNLRGTYLASIPSIIPGFEADPNDPYPWLNSPLDPHHDGILSWSSGGIVHLFLERDGTIHPRVQLYWSLNIGEDDHLIWPEAGNS